jgi:alpha-beta hydrolase superfamily lysophospholipase
MHEEGALVGSRGVALHWRGWLPAGPPRAVVVLSHGLCDHGGRYGDVAGGLVARGVGLYAMDHRGHGLSRGRRAYIGRMAFAVSDLARFLGLVARRHPDTRQFLAGHSMGCVIGLECVLEHSPRLAGLALCAPTVDVSAAPAPVLRGATLLSRIAPGVGVISVFGRERGDSLDEVPRDDPLIHRGRAPARTIAELLQSVARLPERLNRIRVPLLVQHGSADRLVPPRASRLVYDGAGSEDKRIEVYDGLGHGFLSAAAGAGARDDLAGWILERA